MKTQTTKEIKLQELNETRIKRLINSIKKELNLGFEISDTTVITVCLEKELNRLQGENEATA